ncbi:MAG: BrnT family toxin [Thermodesulfovibrionales bacterium]|jgi:uncharacterized DUF497 family protein
MEFRWDTNKSKENLKKHGVSFEEAAEVFDDPLHVSILDKRFDYFDERWITIGSLKKGSIIVAGHLYYLTENGNEIIKIITARKATKKERQEYETIR